MIQSKKVDRGALGKDRSWAIVERNGRVEVWATSALADRIARSFYSSSSRRPNAASASEARSSSAC